MSTIKEIAEASGVSAVTVSKVLNGSYQGRTKRSREIMRRIKKQAQRLNYRPNNAARAMRTQSTGLIGVVIESGGLRSHPVFTEVVQGASEVLKDAGYLLTLSNLTGLEIEALDSRVFTEQLTDGILVFDSAHAPTAEKMFKRANNCVLVNTTAWLPSCCVRRNEYRTGQLAGEKLLRLGYNKIFYFDFDYSEAAAEYHHYSSPQRLAGLKETVDNQGMELEIIRIGTAKVHEWFVNNRQRLTPRSVVIAGSNLYLFCMTSALSHLDLKVGEDFGLVSLDDETGFLATHPGLSRVSFPRLEIGKHAAEMMLNLLAGKKEECTSLEIDGEWIGGSTTRNWQSAP